MTTLFQKNVIQITISVEMHEALKNMRGLQDYLSPELFDELLQALH